MRPEHADLHGVTLPPSDPFWEEFYPPNGWNCRCTVVQVRKSKHPATDPDEAHARGEAALQLDKKGMFRFNPGKQQKAVPDYNPYTISQCRQCDVAGGQNLEMARRTPPASELCAACRLIRERQQQRDTARDIYRRLKDDPDYTDVHFDEQTGGVKATHKGHNFEQMVGRHGIPRGDYEKIATDALYRKGYRVVLADEQTKIDGVKHPDGYLNDSLMDIKGIEGNPLYALIRANKQKVETAVLYFHENKDFNEKDIADRFARLGPFMEYLNQKPIPVYIKTVICVINKGKKDFDVVKIKKPEE